jgi:cytochrome c-type protein NapC
MLRRFWQVFRERYPSRGKAFAILAVMGVVFVVASAVLVVGGAAGLAMTNTEQFCIGCHEMRDNVYAEYKGTIHDTNRTGVRAICSDCHVPREPYALIKRKMRASLELWGHFVGVVDTKQKFESHRAVLAQRVWKRMKETDSLECRNCHHSEKMNQELQSDRAKARHAKARAEGKTCIDCHFGIAHKEPPGPGPEELFAKAAPKP